MTAEHSESQPRIEVETREGYLPAVHRPVLYTEAGTPYLQGPGVVLISVPHVDLREVEGFLNGFPEEYQFVQYLQDPTPLAPAEQLCKVAGQLCYMSFGPARTYNENAARYFANVTASGHGSVLEHANFSFLLYGLSRSQTHELVRHRAGMGYSQVSQRYVSGRVLRFLERPEYQNNPDLHARFEQRIDYFSREYAEIADILLALQAEGDPMVAGEKKTDRRKRVQQAARSVLPNETEAPVVVTGNVRAWRHIINMRASEHAEIEIRQTAFEIYRCLRTVSPILFSDFEVQHLPDGTHAVTTPYPKV